MKRRTILVLVITLFLLFLAILVFLTLYRPHRPGNSNFTNVSPIRAVRVDYLNFLDSRGEVDTLETRMQQVGVNTVALSAGRADWTYFPWPHHPDRWAAEVKTSGVDYLMEDSVRFSRWAHVSAVVDILSPVYIQSHPESAAITWDGTPSKDLVGTMELVDGQFGLNLLSMINEIATYYPVNSITITELVYYVDGYGIQDKKASLHQPDRLAAHGQRSDQH